MIAPIFYFRDGDLFYRGWNWGSDALARHRMERQAAVFEASHSRCPDLAAECRQALAGFDAFHRQHNHRKDAA